MSSETGTTLVVGGDSEIGAALSPRLREAGWRVIETTRRDGADGPDRRWLDLADDPTGALAFLDDEPVQVAFLCAGVTQIAACRADPEATARINVLATEALGARLAEHGAFIVFFSVNQVFDGERPYARPTDPLAPLSEYGRQKAEAERRLQAVDGPVGIVRLTKVLGNSYGVLDSWIAAWKRRVPARPFSDLTMAPVPLREVTESLSRLAGLRAAGIYHVSGARDISYAEAARRGAEVLRVSQDLVQPVTVRASGVALEHAPRHTTLDCALTRERLGFVPPPPGPVIETYFHAARAAEHIDD